MPCTTACWTTAPFSAFAIVFARSNSSSGLQPPTPPQHQQRSSVDDDAVVTVIESALCAHLYVEPREIDRQLTFHEMGVDSIGAVFFFFNDTPPTEIYTLSLHDALPI